VKLNDYINNKYFANIKGTIYGNSNKCESFSLTHHFIVKIHTYHKATCFRYKEPSSGLYIRTDPYLVFGVWLGSQLFTLLEYCYIQHSNLVKLRLKWKTMEYLILTKLEYCIQQYCIQQYCIQQYSSNVNNWDPNRTPKTREESILILEAWWWLLVAETCCLDGMYATHSTLKPVPTLPNASTWDPRLHYKP
jgi:hypothetical protein